MTSLFQQSASLSSVAISEHHQRTELIFHSLFQSDFLDRVHLLTQKLLNQGYVAPRLKSSLQKLLGRHHDLVDSYEISISQMTMDLFLSRIFFFFPLSLTRLLSDSAKKYWVRVAHLVLLSVVCCVLFVFILCLVFPMLPVSLDCPFLIAPSIFSNVYSTKFAYAQILIYLSVKQM